MSKKALLMILDGWGLGDQKKDLSLIHILQNKHDFVTDNREIVPFRLKKCCLVLLFVIEMLYLCEQ